MVNNYNNILTQSHSNSGYSDWGIKRTIREAENVARWNPWLAHAWMIEARDALSLEAPYFSEYDSAVERINKHWLMLKRFRWFNEGDFWEKEHEPGTTTLLQLSSEL